MAEFNYETVEELHQSKLWNNHIFKVKVKGKEKFYVLKLYGGVNESFQKLIFNREMEAYKQEFIEFSIEARAAVYK